MATTTTTPTTTTPTTTTPTTTTKCVETLGGPIEFDFSVNKLVTNNLGDVGPDAGSEKIMRFSKVGTTMDGTEFDSSIKRGEPSEFGLTQVIKGWTEGLQLMKLGAKYEFFIHPKIAYGSRPRPTIPANSLLIFEVELLDIISK